MKVTLKAKASAIALLTLLITGIYFGLTKAKASEADSAKSPATQVEYVFSSNGIMVGAEPSPLEIIQVTRNGAAIPVGGVFKSDMNLLSDAVIRIKNRSNERIRTARLTIDWIDTQEGRTFATMCGLEVSSLAAGSEFAGKVTTISAAEMQKGFAISGRVQQRLFIRYDTVELSDGTMWKHGVMFRKDPNSSSNWIQISQASPNRNKLDNVQVHNASFLVSSNAKPVSAFAICAYWTGFPTSPHYCEGCSCNIYDDDYSFTPQPNGFGRFLFDYIPSGCGGNGWWVCAGCETYWGCENEPTCFKFSIVNYTCP